MSEAEQLLGSASHGQKQLANLIAQVEKLRHLQCHVTASLPADMAAHVKVGWLKSHNLILLVDSSAWATRLRYMTPELLTYLRQQPQGREISNIQCRVEPRTVVKSQSTLPPAKRSAASAACVEQVAASLPGAESGLKASLTRLAKTLALSNTSKD